MSQPTLEKIDHNCDVLQCPSGADAIVDTWTPLSTQLPRAFDWGGRHWNPGDRIYLCWHHFRKMKLGEDPWST